MPHFMQLLILQHVIVFCLSFVATKKLIFSDFSLEFMFALCIIVLTMYIDTYRTSVQLPTNKGAKEGTVLDGAVPSACALRANSLRPPALAYGLLGVLRPMLVVLFGVLSGFIARGLTVFFLALSCSPAAASPPSWQPPKASRAKRPSRALASWQPKKIKHGLRAKTALLLL